MFRDGHRAAVGFTRTISSANLSTQAVVNDWALLESQATAANIDLIGKCTIDRALHGVVYDPAISTSRRESLLATQ